MNQATSNDPRDAAFLQSVKKIQERIGLEMLTDADLSLLAVEEISRTFTREEKQYND